MIRPGYHAGWLWQHDFETILRELAALGFGEVAFRASRANFHPDRDDFSQTLHQMDEVARQLHLGITLDLDGDYLHDPYSAGSNIFPAAETENELQSAVDWLMRWRRAAAETTQVRLLTVSSNRPAPAIGAESTLAGKPDSQDASRDIDFWPRRLAECFRSVAASGAGEAVIAMRPRVGDVVHSVSQWIQWSPWLAPESPEPTGAETDDARKADTWGLAADVGEMIAAAEIPIVDRLLACRNLRCVYLCDREPEERRDVRFGSGQVATAAIVRALRKGGWSGPVIYRYASTGHEGLEPARMAIADFENA